MEIKKYSKDKLEMEFDMIGIDASLANAFRRILLAEVFDRDLLTISSFLCPSIVAAVYLRFRPWPSKKSTYQTTRRAFKTRCWLTGSVSFRLRPIRSCSKWKAIVRTLFFCILIKNFIIYIYLFFIHFSRRWSYWRWHFGVRVKSQM